jgi:uncharacterized phage-like protein YoqJ
MIIAGTGHRPQKLYKTYQGEEYVIRTIQKAISELGKVDYGISGMAVGFDTALARVFVASGIPWTAACPFRGQESKWPQKSQADYHALLKCASKVVFVDELNGEPPGYIAAKMQRRNEYMCNESDTILALWDGTSSGTGNCVNYAERSGKKIINIWQQYLEIVDLDRKP